MRERSGCLTALLQLLLLNWLYDELQQRFGFGRGCSCSGLGCGVLLLVLFLLFACQIITNTDWLRLF